MTDKFKIFLEWMDVEGNILPENIQKVLQAFVPVVVPLWNATAEALNPHYAKWNSEYDESKDGSYDEYIMGKMNSVIAKTPEAKNALFKAEVRILGEDGPQICFVHEEGGYCSILMKPVE